MNMCFVVEDIHPTLQRQECVNGRAIHLYHLALALADAGHRVSFITVIPNRNTRERIEPFDVFNWYSPSAGIPGLRLFTNKAPSLFRAMKAACADAYLFMCAESFVGLCAYLAHRLNKQFILHGANDWDFDGNRLGLSLRDRYLFRWGVHNADLFLCQNEVQKSTLMAYYKKEGHVLYNPMPPADYSYSRSGHIVWVANYRSIKRPELFIRLSQEIDDRFVMIGGRQNSMSVKEFKRINGMATNDNIVIKGQLGYEESDRLISEAKMLVSTSASEGISNTFLQAWRRGIPVVSFVDPDRLIERHKLGVSVNTFEELILAVKQLRHGISAEHSQSIRDFFMQTFTPQQVAQRFNTIVRGHLHHA